MNKIFTMLAMLGLLTFIGSCKLLADEQKTDLLPWPDMVGVPPDKSIKNWIKFDLFGTTNHPFPFLWFSPQQFEREYPNVLIKLNKDEYEQLKLFVRTKECEKQLNTIKGNPLLTVTEYSDDHQAVRCIMLPAKACEYMTKMYALPQITWSAEHTKELLLMGNDLGCDFVNNKVQTAQ